MNTNCNYCWLGWIVNPEKEDEVDKLHDSGQFNYYEAMLKVEDGRIRCPHCSNKS
ncbi:MAG TPA: hypothetical protein VNR38_06115 [Ureibacillus sp.]|nr:hypothetical protein [Ureibacillus sp.]